MNGKTRAIAGSFALVIVLWLGTHWLVNRLWGFHAPAMIVKSPPPAAEDVIFTGYEGTPGANGVPSPWEFREITGKMHVEVRDNQGPAHEKAIWLNSEKAHFLVYRSIVPFDPKTYPLVTWSWEAIQLPKRGDVRTHAQLPFVGDNRNDKAVQVLIAFEGNDVLSYVWDTTAPIGTEVEEWSPVAQVRTRVVESGSDHVGEWRAERVNIYEDYRHRYGKTPGKVIGVSVQTNSNHTASVSEGIVGSIVARRK